MDVDDEERLQLDLVHRDHLAFQCKELNEALQKLFQAYDIDESGTVSFTEFVRLEIRHGLETGDLQRVLEAFPQISCADRNRTGVLQYSDFCKSRMRMLDSEAQTRKLKRVPTGEELAVLALGEAKRTIEERARMGCRYHIAIRKELKEIFEHWRISEDKGMSPIAWILGRADVKKKMGVPMSLKWMSEAAFTAAVGNKGMMVELDGFLRASFDYLEETYPSEAAAAALMLRQLRTYVESSPIPSTVKVDVFVLTALKPDFQLPSRARHDAQAYQRSAVFNLPTNLTLLEDLVSMLRLMLGIPSNKCLAVFGQLGDTLTRLTANNFKGQLERMALNEDPDSRQALFVKNVRLQPERLRLEPLRREEECLSLLHSATGSRWGFDWEVQILGKGLKAPPKLPWELSLSVGDSLVIRVPPTDSGMTLQIYMDMPGVLSSPVAQFVKKLGRSKSSKRTLKLQKAESEAGELKPQAPAGPAPAKRGRRTKPSAAQLAKSSTLRAANEDQLLVFVAQSEGSCTLFVEISWEHREEECTKMNSFGPSADASVARIGPLKVPVQKQSGKARAAMHWWNGFRWTGMQSSKRGPSGAASHRPQSASPQRARPSSAGKRPQSARR